MADFGDLVRRHRRRQGLTQEELAERTGISARTIGKIESGTIAAPRPGTVSLLANAFSLDGAARDEFSDVAAAASGAGPPAPPPPAQPAPAQPAPAQLPGDVAGFVGRVSQLDLLTSVLDRIERGGDDSGAVVITAIGGTAGVGKTALAVRWAHRVRSRFPDGQLYVNLRGYDPDQPVAAADVLAGFLRALGRFEIPPTLDERAAAYRTLLAGRRMLVLLDNASSVEQVRPLLPGAGACVTVVTSRDSLAGLVAREGALRLSLDVLPMADSVALLQAMIGPRVDEDPVSTAVLIEQCARLPLALRVAAELAASRPVTPLTDLVAELRDEGQRLDRLDAGDDDRTRVRVVFSWSYRSLPLAAARLFRLLGQHPGPDITPYAAAALADTSLEQARRVLDQLARAQLIQATAPDRYTQHDLLRAYAAELLATVESTVERRAALTRLFDFYLAATAEATDTLHPGERHRRPVVAPAATPSPPLGATPQALAWLDAERANLARACGHMAANGWPGHAIQLSALLYRYLIVHGHPESQTIHAAARDAAHRTGNGAAEARALVSLGIELGRRSLTRDAEELLVKGVELARAADDLVTEGMGLGALAIISWHLGRYAETLQLLQRALVVHRRSGDAVGESGVLQNLGVLHFLQGRWADAHEHLTLALMRADEFGFRDAQINTLCCRAEVYLRQGRDQEATGCLDRAMIIARAGGDGMGEASVLRDLGQLLMRQGKYDEAVEPLTRAVTVFQSLGIPESAGQAMSRLGEVRRWQGDHGESADLLERALALHQQAGEVADECVTLARLGVTRHAMGRSDDAETLLTQSIALATGAGLRYDEATARAALAEVQLARGGLERARDELHRALRLYEALDVPDADGIRTRIAQLAAPGLD